MRRLVRRIFGSEHDERPSEATEDAALSGTTHSSRAAYPLTLTSSSALLKSGNRSIDDDDDDDGYESPGVLDAATLSELTSQAFAFHNSTVTTGDATATMVVVPARRTTHDGEAERRAGTGWRNADEPGAVDAAASSSPTNSSPVAPHDDADDAVDDFLQNVIAGKTDVLRKQLAQQKLDAAAAAAAAGSTRHGSPTSAAPPGSGFRGSMTRDSASMAADGKEPHTAQDNAAAAAHQQQHRRKYVSSAARSLQDYELIAFLGSGTFAEVTLARNKVTQEYFAVKKISKQRVKEEGCVERTFTERQLLANLHHPFLVRLYQAFQSQTHLYLVLDFAQGGDLFYVNMQQLWLRQMKRGLVKMQYPYYQSTSSTFTAPASATGTATTPPTAAATAVPFASTPPPRPPPLLNASYGYSHSHSPQRDHQHLHTHHHLHHYDSHHRQASQDSVASLTTAVTPTSTNSGTTTAASDCVGVGVAASSSSSPPLLLARPPLPPAAQETSTASVRVSAAPAPPSAHRATASNTQTASSGVGCAVAASTGSAFTTTQTATGAVLRGGGRRGVGRHSDKNIDMLAHYRSGRTSRQHHHHANDDDDDDYGNDDEEGEGDDDDDDDDGNNEEVEVTAALGLDGAEVTSSSVADGSGSGLPQPVVSSSSSSPQQQLQQQQASHPKRKPRKYLYYTTDAVDEFTSTPHTTGLLPPASLLASGAVREPLRLETGRDDSMIEEEDDHDDDGDNDAHPHRPRRALHPASSSDRIRTEKEKEGRSDAAHNDGDHGVPPSAGDEDATSALSQRCHSTRSSSEGGQRGGEDASASAAAAAAAAVAATRPQSSRDTATTAAAATAFSSSNSPPGKPRYHLRRTRRSSRQSGNSGSGGGGAFAGAFSHSFDCIRNNDDDDDDDDDADLETEEGEPFNTSRSSGCDNTDGTPHSRATAPPRRPRRRSSQLTRDSAHTLTSPDAPSRLPPSLAHPSASSSAAAHAAAAGRQRRSTLSTGRGGHESKAESSRTRRSASLSSMAASPADATTAAGTPNITSTPLGEGFWGMAGDGESPVPTGSMHSVSAVDAGGSGGVVAEASASRGEEVASAPAGSSGFATSSFTVTTTAGAAAAAVAMVTVPSATAPPHVMGHHHSNGADDTAEGTADRKRKAKKNRKGSAAPAATAAEDMSSFSDATTAASAAAAAVASGKSKKKKKHHGDHESRGQSVNVSCLSTPLTTLAPTPKPPPPPSATDRNKEEGEEDDREHHDDDGADTETHSTRHDKKKKKKDKTEKKKKHSHHRHNHDSKTSGNTPTAPTPFAVDAPLANATPAPPQTPMDNASEHTSNGAAAAAAAGRFSAAPEVVAAARGIAYPSRSPGGATPAQEAAANAAAAHVDLAAPFRQVGMEQSQTPLRDLPPSKFAPDDTHRFPLKLIAFYAVEVALVLQYLHGEGFLYRDLKPENILMRGDGHVMLTDFGVAKYRKGAAIATSAGLSTNNNNNSSGGAKEHDAGGALGAKADDSGNPAATTAADGKANSFTGTTQYMSPEMLRGLPHDSRTDWWSYGCLLFEWANGRKAFDGANQFSLFRSIVEEDVKVTPNDYRLTPLEVHTRVAQLHYRSEELRLEYEERAARRLRRSGGLGTSLQTSMGGGAAAAAATSSPPVTAEVVYNRENRSFDIRLLTPPVAGAAANTSDPSDPTAAAVVDSAATTPHPGSCRTASNVSFVPSPAATPHPPAVMSPATQLPPAVPPDALSGSLTVSNGSGMTMMQQQQHTMSNIHSSSHRHHYQRPSDRSFAGQYANNNSSSNAVAAGAVAALLNDSFAVQQQQYDPHRSGSAVTSTTTTHQQQPPPPPTNLSVVNDSFANASFASVQHNSVFSVAGTPNNLSLRLTTTEDGGIAALVSSNASPTALRQQQQQQERMRRNRRRRARLSCLAIDPATRDRYLDDALQQMEEAQELLRDLTLKLLDRSVDTRLCGEAVLEHPFFTCSYVVSQLYYRVYQQRLLPRELRRSAKLGMTGLGSCPSFTDLTASLRDDGLPGGTGGTSPSSNSFALPGGGFSGAGNTNNNNSLCQYPGSMFGSFIALPSQRRPDDWRELFLNRSIRAVYTPRLRTRDDLRYFPAAVTATGLSAAVEQHRRIKEVKEQQKELLRATKATMMMMNNNNANNNNSITTNNNNNNAATSTTGGSNVNIVEGVGSDSLAGTLTAAGGVVVVPLDEAAAQQMQQILANSSTSGSINININGRSTTTSNNASGVFSVRPDGPAHDDGFSHSPSPVPPPAAAAAAAAGNETVVPALESSQRRSAAGGEGHAMESATAQPELQLASPLGPASASAAAAAMTMMNDTVTAGTTREAGGVDPFASPVSDSAVHPLTEEPGVGEHTSHPAVTAAAARVQVVEDLSSVLPAAVSRDAPQPLTPTIVVAAASPPPPPPPPLPSPSSLAPAAAAAAHEGSTEAASTSTAVRALQPRVHDEGQAVRDALSSSGTTGDVGDNSNNKKKCVDNDDMHDAGGGKGDVGEENADAEQHDPHHQRLSHPPGGAVVTLVNTAHSAPTTPALSLANIGDEADSAAFSTPAVAAARGRSSPISAAATVSEAVSTEKDTYAVTAGTSLLSSSLASSLLPPRPRPPHPHGGDYLVSSGGHRNEMESEGGTAVSDVASPLSMMAGGTDNSMDNASRASLTSSSQLFDRAATLPQSFVDAALAVAAAAAHKKQQQQHLHQTQQQQQHALTPGSSFASFAHTDGGFSHGAATAPSSPLLMRRSSTVPMKEDEGADEGKQQQQQERNRAASLASGGQPTNTAAAAGGGGAEIDTRGTTAPVNVVHAGESMQGLAGAATAPSAGAECGENHHATTARDAMLAADIGGGGEAGEKPALTTQHRQVNAVDDDHTPAANTRLTIAIASGVVDRASEEVANRMALDDNGSEMHEMDDDDDDDDAIAAGGGGYYEQDAFEEQRADDDDDFDHAARVSDDRAEHDHDKSDPLHQHSSRGRALQESGLTSAIADDTASIATTTTTTAPTTAETSVSQGHLTPQRPLPGDASLLSPDTSHDRDRHHRANPLAPGSDLSYDDSSLSGSVRSSITTSTLFTDARGDAGVSSNSPGSSSGDNSGLRRPALPFVVPVTALPLRSAEAADTIASTVAPQSHTNGPADPHSCHDTPGAAHEEGDSGIVEHLQSAMVERVCTENSEGSAPTASTTATTTAAAAATEATNAFSSSSSSSRSSSPAGLMLLRGQLATPPAHGSYGAPQRVAPSPSSAAAAAEEEEATSSPLPLRVGPASADVTDDNGDSTTTAGSPTTEDALAATQALQRESSPDTFDNNSPRAGDGKQQKEGAPEGSAAGVVSRGVPPSALPPSDSPLHANAVSSSSDGAESSDDEGGDADERGYETSDAEDDSDSDDDDDDGTSSSSEEGSDDSETAEESEEEESEEERGPAATPRRHTAAFSQLATPAPQPTSAAVEPHNGSMNISSSTHHHHHDPLPSRHGRGGSNDVYVASSSSSTATSSSSSSSLLGSLDSTLTTSSSNSLHSSSSSSGSLSSSTSSSPLSPLSPAVGSNINSSIAEYGKRSASNRNATANSVEDDGEQLAAAAAAVAGRGVGGGDGGPAYAYLGSPGSDRPRSLDADAGRLAALSTPDETNNSSTQRNLYDDNAAAAAATAAAMRETGMRGSDDDRFAGSRHALPSPIPVVMAAYAASSSAASSQVGMSGLAAGGRPDEGRAVFNVPETPLGARQQPRHRRKGGKSAHLSSSQHAPLSSPVSGNSSSLLVGGSGNNMSGIGGAPLWTSHGSLGDTRFFAETTMSDLSSRPEFLGPLTTTLPGVAYNLDEEMGSVSSSVAGTPLSGPTPPPSGQNNFAAKNTFGVTQTSTIGNSNTTTGRGGGGGGAGSVKSLWAQQQRKKVERELQAAQQQQQQAGGAASGAPGGSGGRQGSPLPPPVAVSDGLRGFGTSRQQQQQQQALGQSTMGAYRSTGTPPAAAAAESGGRTTFTASPIFPEQTGLSSRFGGGGGSGGGSGDPSSSRGTDDFFGFTFNDRGGAVASMLQGRNRAAASDSFDPFHANGDRNAIPINPRQPRFSSSSNTNNSGSGNTVEHYSPASGRTQQGAWYHHGYAPQSPSGPAMLPQPSLTTHPASAHHDHGDNGNSYSGSGEEEGEDGGQHPTGMPHRSSDANLSGSGVSGSLGGFASFGDSSAGHHSSGSGGGGGLDHFQNFSFTSPQILQQYLASTKGGAGGGGQPPYGQKPRRTHMGGGGLGNN